MKKFIPGLIALSACGSSYPTTVAPGAVQVTQSNGDVTYTLTATADSNGPHPASLTVDKAARVTMPQVIAALSNANYVGRADLTIGATFCAYVSDGQGVYVRQDGACNTFNPSAPIQVSSGDTVSLTLEGSPDSPVSVETIINGEAV